MPSLWSEERAATQNAPSKPYLTDDRKPTDPRLWLRVLQVAKGRRRQMTRIGPKGPRTIHAPHHGRGFRHWPNPKAVAWAVKQYNGYGGKWEGQGEEAVTASDKVASLQAALTAMKAELDARQHTLDDVAKGRVPVGVEGASGQDILLARKLGLFTCNILGIDIFARCEEDARPLIHYLERGGQYGSLEFSRLLGYTDSERDLYRRYLLLSAEVPHPEGLNPYQRTALSLLRLGSVLTTKDESNEQSWMTDLEQRGLVQLTTASIPNEECYWDITAAGHRFVTARLSDDLIDKMDRLLGEYDLSEAKKIGAWLEQNFRFKSPKTPKGQKDLKDEVNKLWWALSFGGETYRDTIAAAWEAIRPRVKDLIRYFTDEGGVVVPDSIQVGGNTYLNKAGLNAATLEKYAKRLEQVFDTITGWRSKALTGGLKVAFGSPRDMHGTATGKYKSDEDTLYVRTTPAVMKRDSGYAGFDYILVHELGHRYERKNRIPEDFDDPDWWTSKYSRKEGEGFAELFAIGHYRLKGSWDDETLDRFEKVMT
jgi:hypothetical protein